MMKFFSFLICVIFTTTTNAYAQDTNGIDFAKGISDKLLTEVSKSSDTLAEKQKKFRDIFIKAIDVKTVVRFTLSSYARKATPEQIDAYTNALVDNIVYTWTARFSAYKDAMLTFESQRLNKNKDIFVSGFVQFPDSVEKIDMKWRLTNKTGELKILDLIFEGISMLMSYRNEYSGYLQQNGGDIDKLISSLNEKNKMLKNIKPKS